MGQLVMGQHMVTCRCGKVVCLSEDDANMLARKFAKRHGNFNKVRVYRCDYGPWHWSSKLEWPVKR